MRNYGVPNRPHPQCAFIDEGQVEIKRREGKRGERRGGKKWKKFIQKPLYISPLNLDIA